MLALSSLLQMPKPNHRELQNFEARVAADQQELRTLLAQRVRQAWVFAAIALASENADADSLLQRTSIYAPPERAHGSYPQSSRDT